jgi:hypothetical protein
MSKISKAQTGTSIPSSSRPMLDESFMEQRYGQYKSPSGIPEPARYKSPIPFAQINTGTGGQQFKGDAIDQMTARLNSTVYGQGGPKTRTLDQYKGSERYKYFNPDPQWDNEDAAAQGQGWGTKMVNGVSKGLVLTGTTFLQNTVGLINGVYQGIADGRFASFYDNDFNRALDELNKELENELPNYYTRQERDAAWYSPDYFFTGNFLWDGIVKNMGFAAGTYLSAGVYTGALKALPSVSKLVAAGKGAEALAATEAGLASADKVAGTFGKIRSLSDKFLTQSKFYNLANNGQRAVVSALSTTGEAGSEALHNMNEFREGLVQEYINKNGVLPQGEDLEKINQASESAANKALFANVGLLTVTNYIQLPKILGSSYNAEKGILNGITRQIDDVVSTGGELARKSSKYPFLSRLNKIRPYIFTTSEAFEESAQFSIGVATKDYYQKAYNGDPTDWLSSIEVGITEGMFSDEGAKNALIGGLSGALMTGRGRYRKNKAKQKATNEALTALNSTNLGQVISNPDFKFTDFTNETFDSVNRGTVLQQEREEALKVGDILNSKDLEADYIINYLTPRIKYGRYDLVKADIDQYKALANTEEGFAQLQAEGKALQTDTREAYIERLNQFEQTADNFKSLWQTLNVRYGGEILKDDNDNPVLTEDGKNILKYPPSVMNQMLYSALKVADYDKRILSLSQSLTTAGINTEEVIQQIADGKVEAFNEAVEIIKNTNVIDDTKQTLGQNLDDLAEITSRRQQFIKTYENIKNNPKEYISERPQETETPTAPVETVKVKTKQGEKNVEIGTEYFAGKGVDYSKDALDSPIPISRFTVLGVNENGTLKIKNLDTGKESDISPDKFENLKVGKVSTLQADKTANYYYNHRNEIFEYNFGKNFGGKRKGRLEYQDGKLYFVYLTPKGKVAKKELNNSHFVAQEGFDRPRISKIGSVENQQQKDSREQFMSPEEIAKQQATLAKNREARLEVLTQLGEEAQENLTEVNKKLDKAKEELSKVKEDFENIKKMKEAGPTGPKIKLNFSKATKSFTRALNRLEAMQNDLNEVISNAEIEKEELEFNISYFQDFANQITDGPEDSGEFLQELKDQVKLLVDNGKSLNNAIKAAKKLAESAKKTVKSAAKVFRSALKSTYIIDEDYSQYLSDLLDQVVSGEDLSTSWSLLKQEMANFALTSDLSKEVNINEPGLIEAIDNLKKTEKDLADLRAEYKARKIITDRFQNIMDQYNAQKAAEEKLQIRLNQVMATADKGVATNSFETSYEPESKKSLDVLPRSTTFRDVRETGGKLKPDEARANQFGLDLDSFDNREKIRGVYVTSETQNQLLPGVIELMLDEDPELIKDYKDSMIVMVMVDETGLPVGVDGKPIPEGESLLDNAVFQAIPEEGFGDGSMFRDGVDKDTKDYINKEYKKFRDGILAQETLGVPHKISASFGVPQFVKDSNGKIVYETRTSVQDAGLITASDLETEVLLNIPTTDETVSKGTSQYTSPLGSVFLELKNGLVKLRNRQHTSKDASAIYDSILQLAKNMIDPNEGITSNSSVRILEFLKGVTYWGIPANEPGNNSVFFEKGEDGKLMLRLSDEGVKYRFTPKQLELNKDAIIQTLESMYNNVNKSKTLDINRKFEQITSISPEGEIKSTVWPNYQSYLLSKKGREDFELPLYTLMKPKVEGEFNREGVYFINMDTADDFQIPEPSSQATNIPIKEDVTYVPDGETTNTYTSPQGKKILFKFKPIDGVVSKDSIEILPGGDRSSVPATDDQIKAVILNSIQPGVIKKNQQEAYDKASGQVSDDPNAEKFVIGEEPAPKAPASKQPTEQASEVEKVVGTPAQQAQAENELDELNDLINQELVAINSQELGGLIKEEIDINLEDFDSTDVKELEDKGYSKEQIKEILIKKCKK